MMRLHIPTVEEIAPAPLENRISAFVAGMKLAGKITQLSAVTSLPMYGLTVCEIGAVRFDAIVDEILAQREAAHA